MGGSFYILLKQSSVELKIMKSFMATLLKHTAVAGTVPMSSPVHIHTCMYVTSHPLCKETISLLLVFILIFISTILRQLGFNLRPSKK